MNRQALIDRISDTFCVEPDYLWSKSSDAAVFRHAVSRKWFGLLMSVSPQSLRIPGDARIDILNVKCDPLLNGSGACLYFTPRSRRYCITIMLRL